MRVLFASLASVGHTAAVATRWAGIPGVWHEFANAEALTAVGAALCLRPQDVSAGAVADQVRTLLADRGYSVAARGIAEEIGRMPSPAEVARRLPDHAAHG